LPGEDIKKLFRYGLILGCRMVGTTEAAKLLEVTPRRVRDYLIGGRVHGAFKVGKTWVIPLIDGLPVITEGKRGPKPTRKISRTPKPTVVHVNTKLFGQKDIEGNYVPVITTKIGEENVYCETVVIPGPCKIVYNFDAKLKSGAKCWIETYQEPTFIGEKLTYAEIEARLAKTK
jgi:hypothetical protein